MLPQKQIDEQTTARATCFAAKRPRQRVSDFVLNVGHCMLASYRPDQTNATRHDLITVSPAEMPKNDTCRTISEIELDFTIRRCRPALTGDECVFPLRF